MSWSAAPWAVSRRPRSGIDEAGVVSLGTTDLAILGVFGLGMILYFAMEISVHIRKFLALYGLRIMDHLQVHSKTPVVCIRVGTAALVMCQPDIPYLHGRPRSRCRSRSQSSKISQIGLVHFLEHPQSCNLAMAQVMLEGAKWWVELTKRVIVVMVKYHERRNQISPDLSSAQSFLGHYT